MCIYIYINSGAWNSGNRYGPPSPSTPLFISMPTVLRRLYKYVALLLFFPAGKLENRGHRIPPPSPPPPPPPPPSSLSPQAETGRERASFGTPLTGVGRGVPKVTEIPRKWAGFLLLLLLLFFICLLWVFSGFFV